jgi:hypothetical protein
MALATLTFESGLLLAQSLRLAGQSSYGCSPLVGNRQVARVGLETGATKVWQLLTQVGMEEGDLCSGDGKTRN